MESKLDKKNQIITEEKAETPKSKLLEERKAQAKELAALREAHFSIDEELNNIYEMLVNEDEEVGSLEPSSSETPIEIDLPKPKPLTKAQIEAQKAREKAKLEKEKEKEKLRLQKQKEKEKEKLRLQKQKEKEKEKLRLQKQKEKEREKLRLQKQKEKEREKLRLQKQKEKEKEKLRLQKEKEKAKQGTSTVRKTTTKKVPLETDTDKLTKTNEERSTIEAMSEDKKFELKDEKLNSENDNLADSDEEAKKFFGNKPTTVASNILERPKEKKESGIIDNLQRLREQIMAQKRLERELMELEAKNVQKKELTLKSKLSELESLAREEEELERQDYLIEQLELEKEQLAEQLRTEQNKVKRLLSLKYSDVNVINPEKLILSDEFLDSITAVSAEALYNELEAVQNELTELREIHELNRKTIMERASQKETSAIDSERYIEIFNKLRGDIEKYRQKSTELEKQLAEVNKEKERLLFEEKERIDKAIIKKQNELDIKYLNKEASLISEYEAKIEEIRTSLKAKLIENVNKAKLGLEAKYKGKIKDQNALARELKKQTDKVAESTQLIDKLKYDLQIAENEINSKTEQLEYLQTKLLEMDSRVDDTLIVGLQNRITSLETDLAAKTKEVIDLSIQLASKTEEIERLKIELNEVDKVAAERITQGYTNQISQLEMRVETLTKEIDTLNAKIEELNKYNANLNTIYLDQQDELTKVIEERDNLTAEVNKQNKLISEKNNELTLLQAQSSNELHGYSQEYLKQINNLKTENDNKNKEILSLQKQLDDFRKTHNETEKYLGENKQQVIILQQELDTLTTNYQKLQNELNLTSTNLIQANANLTKALEERDNLTRQLQNLTNDYLQSEAELAKLANELDIIKENIHDPERDKIRKVNEELFDLQAKLSTIKTSYETQIASFQEQVNELTSLLSTQKLQLDDKINEVQELKNVINEIESSQVNEDKKDEEPEATPINDQIQKLIAAYTKERDLLAYTHKNTINRLEVEKKFARSSHEAENIDRKINELVYRYQETLARNNNKFQAEIQALLGTNETVTETPAASQVSEDLTTIVEQDSPQVAEPQVLEEQVQEVDEPQVVEDQLQEEQPQVLEEELHEEQSQEPEAVHEQETLEAESQELEAVQEQDMPEEELQEPEVTLEEADDTPTMPESQVAINNEQQSQFISIVNKEYLDRLNNIHRMRRNLEAKKQDYLHDYENATIATNENHEDIKRKIAEVKAKINLLEQQYRQNKGYHPDREREYENNKTKLYLELEGRQEKLRKLQEEENRVHSLKYKNLIKNIEEQLEILDKEERQLKEYYLNKQNKLQSKINRENEILEKLQAEKSAPVEEGRVIESQAEIKERMLSEDQHEETTEDVQEQFAEIEAELAEEETVQEETIPETEVEEAEMVDVDEAAEAEQLADIQDADDGEVQEEELAEQQPVDVQEVELDEHQAVVVQEEELDEQQPVAAQEMNQEKLSSINAKEQELRNLYNKYANAEAVLVRENKYVREYKNTRNEVLAYDSENKRLNASIEELTNALDNATSEQAREIKDKIKQHEVRKNLIAKRVSYLDKQLIKMESNSFVQEYRKVIEKLESMEDIFQKYHEVKQKLR